MATTHFQKTVIIGAEVKAVGGVFDHRTEVKAAGSSIHSSEGNEVKKSPKLADVSGEVKELHQIDTTRFGGVNVVAHTPPVEDVDSSRG